MATFHHDGLALAYRDEGEGLPVLCLPGLTRNAADFDDLAAALDRDVRLIRPDYRGRGGSDRAAPETYNVVAEAKDALALLDHLGVEKAFFVGTSRGGIISMVTATMAKDRMLGVVLNDVGPEIGPAGWAAILDYVGIRPKAKTYDEAAVATATRMAAQFPGVPRSRWRVAVERWFAETPDGLELRYDPALRDTLLAQADKPAPDLWPLFDALEGVPLGLIRGANSDLLTDATVVKMRARRPDMRFALVPDRGHIPFLDEAESLALIRAMTDAAQP